MGKLLLQGAARGIQMRQEIYISVVLVLGEWLSKLRVDSAYSDRNSQQLTGGPQDRRQAPGPMCARTVTLYCRSWLTLAALVYGKQLV